MNHLVSQITDQLSAFFKSVGLEKAVIGLSGGVDSALVAKLAVLSLGAENVSALIMPNNQLTKAENIKDAQDWAKELGIHSELITIDHFIENYQSLPWDASELAVMNLQARLRMTLLYHYANSTESIVLGTGNKTELMLGYFTKYGDGGVDVLPIGDLYKSEVWEMGHYLNLPENILTKAPSAELAHEQTDEEEMGMPYAEIDQCLKAFESGQKPNHQKEQALYNRLLKNEHKLKMAPILKIN